MTRIKVSDKEFLNRNLLYLQNTLSEIFRQTDCRINLYTDTGRATLDIDVPNFYYPLILSEVLDKVADVLVIGYKYRFFSTRLCPSGLKNEEKDLLITGIIAADYEDDKRYVLSKLKGNENPAIDGVYNFKLRLLREKWEEIVSFMPKVFGTSQLKDFLVYLLEGKKNKIYVENGKAYDSHYRRLIRSGLTDSDGDENLLVKEIILSLPGEIELRSALPEKEEKFIKDFFGSRINFK